MKIVALIARILLGLVFVVFGLNKLFNFLSLGPLPTGVAAQFFGALIASHLLIVVALLEIISGALLLIGRYVPLALTLVGPVVVNILLFHSLMAPSGLPVALVVVLLWLVVFYSVRSAFAGIFLARA